MKRYKTQLGIQPFSAKPFCGGDGPCNHVGAQRRSRLVGAAIIQPARRSDSGGGSSNHSIQTSDDIIKTYSTLINSEVIAIDPNYYRPTEVDLLIGDPSKAKVYPPIFKAGEVGLASRDKVRRISEIDG